MRLVYDSIQFELTRRCNQNCLHCCRGCSQNMDISKSVIDAFFDKNDIDSIYEIRFSGGEPTLNGSGLLYLVNRLLNSGIKVQNFFLSVNGLNYNEEFVKAINLLNEYCKSFYSNRNVPRGHVCVSQTQYHQPALIDVINRFKELPYFIVPDGMQYIASEDLLPYGNAILNGLTNKTPDLAYVMDYNRNIVVKEYQGQTFLCFDCQYISSNGNVLVDGCVSYDIMDKYHIGNVLEKPIYEMYSEQPKVLEFMRRQK